MEAPSMFNVPNGNLLITGGNFELNTQAGTVKVPLRVIQKAFKNSYAPDASYDTNDVLNPPKCHPNTRTALLHKLAKWARSSETRSHILWMYGPAGSGKSAIARSLAQVMEAEGRLGASFFFLRTAESRNHEKLFVSTIAYQIALSIPRLQPYIAQNVERNPLIFCRSLEKQFKQLIVDPIIALDRIYGSGSPEADFTTHLIIIDGLDECQNPPAQTLILRMISDAIPHLSGRLKFLVLSRLEDQIQRAFAQPRIERITVSIDLKRDLDTLDDIRTFLSDKFAEIRDSHPFGSNLQAVWPGEDAIERLVRRSGSAFIYPHVVMRYIESSYDRPERRLKVILELSPASDRPYAELDDLFRHILMGVRRDRLSFMKILSVLVAFGMRYGPDTPRIGFTKYGSRTRFIENILGLDKGELKLCLIDLQSLVVVDESKSEPVFEFLHTSFPDFLLDARRSAEFSVNLEEAYRDIALGALRVLSLCKFPCVRKDYYDIHKDKETSGLSFDPAQINPSNNQLVERRVDTIWELEQARFDVLFWSCSKALPCREILNAMHGYNSTILYDTLTTTSYGDHSLQSWSFASDVITNFFKCVKDRRAFKNEEMFLHHRRKFDGSLKRQLGTFYKGYVADALTLLVCFADHLSESRSHASYRSVWDIMIPLFNSLIPQSGHSRQHNGEGHELCRQCGLETAIVFAYTLPSAEQATCDVECLGNFERSFLDRLRDAVTSADGEKLELIQELKEFSLSCERSGTYHVTRGSVASLAVRCLQFICAPSGSTEATSAIDKAHECFLLALIALIMWLMYDNGATIPSGGYYYSLRTDLAAESADLHIFLRGHTLRSMAGRAVPWQFRSMQNILHENLGRLIEEYLLIMQELEAPLEDDHQPRCLINRTSIATFWSPFSFEAKPDIPLHSGRKRAFSDFSEDELSLELTERQRTRTS